MLDFARFTLAHGVIFWFCAMILCNPPYEQKIDERPTAANPNKHDVPMIANGNSISFYLPKKEEPATKFKRLIND